MLVVEETGVLEGRAGAVWVLFGVGVVVEGVVWEAVEGEEMVEVGAEVGVYVGLGDTGVVDREVGVVENVEGVDEVVVERVLGAVEVGVGEGVTMEVVVSGMGMVSAGVDVGEGREFCVREGVGAGVGCERITASVMLVATMAVDAMPMAIFAPVLRAA